MTSNLIAGIGIFLICLFFWGLLDGLCRFFDARARRKHFSAPPVLRWCNVCGRMVSDEKHASRHAIELRNVRVIR